MKRWLYVVMVERRLGLVFFSCKSYPFLSVSCNGMFIRLEVQRPQEEKGMCFVTFKRWSGRLQSSIICCSGIGIRLLLSSSYFMQSSTSSLKWKGYKVLCTTCRPWLFWYYKSLNLPSLSLIAVSPSGWEYRSYKKRGKGMYAACSRDGLGDCSRGQFHHRQKERTYSLLVPVHPMQILHISLN